MNKRFLIILLTICMALSLFVVPVMAEDEIKVILNSGEIDFATYNQEPVIVNGRTMVPLRAVFEALSAIVSWDNNTQTVTAIRGNVTVMLTVGSDRLYVNGVAKTIDVPAMLLNDRTMVPVRCIAEAFGCNVSWHNDKRCVVIVDGYSTVENYVKINQCNDVYNLIWNEIKVGNFAQAGKYYESGTLPGELSGYRNVIHAVVGMMNQTDTELFTMEQKVRMESVCEKYIKAILANIEYTTGFAYVTKTGEVCVDTTIMIPDFENFDEMQLVTSQESMDILINTLAKFGYTAEQLRTLSEEELKKVDIEYGLAVVEYMYDIGANMMGTLQKVEHLQTVKTFKLINSQWMIAQ